MLLLVFAELVEEAAEKVGCFSFMCNLNNLTSCNFLSCCYQFCCKLQRYAMYWFSLPFLLNLFLYLWLSLPPDQHSSGSNEGHLLLLKHPKSGISTTYHFINESLQELHWFKQPYGSWFLGDYVCEDGGIYVSTPIDPIFILLPIFEGARLKKGEDAGKFRQMIEIIFVEGHPGYQHLLSIAENYMPLVCDVKEVGSTKFFRLNDSKVLTWLCIKVNRLMESLLKLGNNYAAQDKKHTLVDALSITGEYLKDEPWLKLLCDHLRLDVEELNIKAHGIDILPSGPDNALGSSAVQEGGDTGKKKVQSNARQGKKVRVEKDSHNIKEMFSRATRRGSKSS